MTVNQCGAGWGGFESAGNWSMRNLGGHLTMGNPGGGGDFFVECEHKLLQNSSILCVVVIRLQSVVL